MPPSFQGACIDSSWTSGTSTLEFYNLNFITRQLFVQNSPNSRTIQYWLPGVDTDVVNRKQCHSICFFLNRLLFCHLCAFLIITSKNKRRAIASKDKLDFQKCIVIVPNYFSIYHSATAPLPYWIKKHRCQKCEFKIVENRNPSSTYFPKKFCDILKIFGRYISYRYSL